jgi:hypothetical protein
MASVATHPSSLPGLTRQSIILVQEALLMDARVKPAHDAVMIV